MLLRTPAFYHQFHCIADKCTDTCCVGWEIDVDENTQAKYCQYSKTGADQDRKAFSKKVLENIQDGHFILKAGDRCPFLMENGLCEMICKMGCKGSDIGEDGENVLCDICREHPRFVEVYGDIMEKGIGLCCEEGVKLLLTSDSFSFVESEVDDEPDEMPEGAEEARDAIFEEREAIFSILNNKSVSLNERLLEVLDFAEAVSDVESLDSHSERSTLCGVEEYSTALPSQWLDVLSEGESYGPAWDAAFTRMKSSSIPTSLFTEEDGARVIAYLVFRYYAKSLFDGDSLTKVQFAIYFWMLLNRFGKELADITSNSDLQTLSKEELLTAKINAVKLLSKQTEYSEEIMEILADNFFQNEAFSVNQFRRILSSTQS